MKAPVEAVGLHTVREKRRTQASSTLSAEAVFVFHYATKAGSAEHSTTAALSAANTPKEHTKYDS